MKKRFIKKIRDNVWNKWSVISEGPNDIIDKYNGEITFGEKRVSNPYVDSSKGLDFTGETDVNEKNFLLRGCTLKNTKWVLGLVVFTGHETKIMLNSQGARYKKSSLEKDMNM